MLEEPPASPRPSHGPSQNQIIVESELGGRTEENENELRIFSQERCHSSMHALNRNSQTNFKNTAAVGENRNCRLKRIMTLVFFIIILMNVE